ncbi:ABC transporter ATP-binding protein [Aliidiomarina soli]|uniref:ABC transporter ATP-binding protein n=1 Tax=Aliidiomarina soli TaxID=1928574 RepID=A0A432WME7_9GAMM|nr:ATP-binding cassette domain-containing protein [Aliidiomarina soli]RUO34901.1 ABC transporter ATP-binding protein [Aliidiomarina soli]
MVSKGIISVRGLHNQFGDNLVHEQLDLDVAQGEILTVVGGSGSGKSVLMRSILGLHRPSAGQIEVDGVDLLRADSEQRVQLERRMGVLFQRGALYSSLTVLENVLLPLQEHLSLPAEDAEALALMKLRLVGLSSAVADNSVQSLSGGMIKRVALARALILEPDFLFLDEPTAGLDPIGANDFDELLVTVQRALGLTVFLVTHDVDSIFKVSDRVAVLAERKVLVVDTPERVATHPDQWIQAYFQGPRGRAAQQGKRHPVNAEEDA